MPNFQRGEKWGRSKIPENYILCRDIRLGGDYRYTEEKRPQLVQHAVSPTFDSANVLLASRKNSPALLGRSAIKKGAKCSNDTLTLLRKLVPLLYGLRTGIPCSARRTREGWVTLIPRYSSILTPLNALNGMRTLQSCAGHRIARNGALPDIYTGNLWLRLDEYTSCRFYDHGFRWIQSSPLLYRAGILFRDCGREIIDIHFAGLESDPADFAAAANEIAVFFASLSGRR